MTYLFILPSIGISVISKFGSITNNAAMNVLVPYVNIGIWLISIRTYVCNSVLPTPGGGITGS